MTATIARYYIDERTGCIAVRDHTKDSEMEPGLHANTTGVIRYWHGELRTEKCAKCGHAISAGWRISDDAKRAAEELCDELNASNKVPVT